MPSQSPTPPDNVGQMDQSRERLTRKSMLKKPDTNATLRLKSGETESVTRAIGERNMLEDLLRREPQAFDVLVRICHGETPTAPDEEWKKGIARLKAEIFLKGDGTVRPIVQRVLLSSYQATPEGPVLTQPFDLAGEQQKQMADLIQQQMDDYKARFFQKLIRNAQRKRSR